MINGIVINDVEGVKRIKQTAFMSRRLINGNKRVREERG